ncbi:MAG TPA: hypothetical protein VJH33_00455 [Candidatus Paceibacterota bacterium]
MPKDYFEDIPASSSSAEQTKSPESRAVPIREVSSDRSIRNIPSPRARSRVPVATIESKTPWKAPDVSGITARYSRWWIWVVAGATLLVLGGVLVFAFRPTTITVVPRSHAIVFDASKRFTAYPSASAPFGALAYTVETREFEDSAAVPSDGVEQVSDKAHGMLTVVNEYSASPVRLIKNTRFQTPQGLVFRVPNTITVPGKKGSVGGTIAVEVYADQPGSDYNVGPVSRFSLPGLKSSADMYGKVYARSDTAFSGGFVGERPKVDPKTLASARAEVRSRLTERASNTLSAYEGGLVLPGLLNLAFSSLPETAEAEAGVRIHEKIVATFPVFSSESFAEDIAGDAIGDIRGATLRFAARETFSATADTQSLQGLGKNPLLFTLQGEGMIVFDVDGEGLASALAGRETASFETIVSEFAGIETARAKVGPFWSSTFPDDPVDIRVTIESNE